MCSNEAIMGACSCLWLQFANPGPTAHSVSLESVARSWEYNATRSTSPARYDVVYAITLRVAHLDHVPNSKSGRVRPTGNGYRLVLMSGEHCPGCPRSSSCTYEVLQDVETAV